MRRPLQAGKETRPSAVRAKGGETPRREPPDDTTPSLRPTNPSYGLVALIFPFLLPPLAVARDETDRVRRACKMLGGEMVLTQSPRCADVALTATRVRLRDVGRDDVWRVGRHSDAVGGGGSEMCLVEGGSLGSLGLSIIV